MLETLIIIIILLWALGLIGNVGGSLIHLLLVVALAVFIVRLIQGRQV